MTNSEKMKRARLDVDYRKWLYYTPENITLQVSNLKPSKILKGSFMWEFTKEGFNYWDDIYHALKLLK